MRRQLIYYFATFLITGLSWNSLAQEQTHKLSSQGGGRSEGGTYTNISAIGGEVVHRNILGGTYSGQAGFLYSVFSETQTENLQDSLALVDLFMATRNEKWKDSTNWLTGNLDTWFGVTMENGKVTALSLPDNNLTGRIPSSINNLSEIITIEIQDNALVEIPDMARMTTLNLLDVSGNNLEFGSLEPNVSVAGIKYQNQDSIGVYNYSEVEVGSNFPLGIITSGDGNIYQWYFKGQPITGAGDPTFTIENIGRTSMGDYYVEVTNSMVPDLTLTGRVNIVNATASITGQIRLSDGAPLPDGDVKLLQIVENGYDTLHISEVDQQGSYLIEGVILYDYLLVATGDISIYPNEFPTYYSQAIFWEEADTLEVSGNIENLDIDLESIEGLALEGPGVIFATFDEDVPDENGRITIRKRVASAGVSVRRKVRAGRKNPYPNSRIMEDYELVAFLYTNDKGEVTFEDLEPDTYRINFQYPGFPMDEESILDIVIGSKKTGDEERIVNAVVLDGKIKVVQNTVVGVDGNLLLPEVRVFPNPVQSFLNVTAPADGFSSYKIVMWDSKGALMDIGRKLNGDIMVLDLQSLPKGIYILTLIDEESNGIVKSFKIILSE